MDGSVLLVMDKFNSLDTAGIDLSPIPTLKFPTGNELAFLLCSPHASIQTRQVRATGNGNLTLGKPQQSQGNIDFYHVVGTQMSLSLEDMSEVESVSRGLDDSDRV